MPSPWVCPGRNSTVTLRRSKLTIPSIVSGQVSHDDKGNIVGLGDMEVQMRQAYANIEKVLAQYDAAIDNVVEEVLFVTDMDAAFAARVRCRQEVFSGNRCWRVPLYKSNV
jgi:enamine deaminase RidA (YjgF/YER057c/UK114 family)